MDRAAIILAGSLSSRLSYEPGLLVLNGKPLISHVIDGVKGFVEEVIVVASSQECVDKYRKLLTSKVNFIVNRFELEGIVVGALKGFTAANSEYALLLPVNSPFVSKDVFTLFFDCCLGKSAVIPRHTNMEMEPLHAVYNIRKAIEATKEAFSENKKDLQDVVEKMRGVRYVSTMLIEQLDPDLKTFFSINTLSDLKKAEIMLKPRKTSKKKTNTFEK